MKLARNYKLGIAIAVIALLAYVSFLLTTNYLSQKNLQQTLLEQFRLENESHATEISHFFSERREDLRNLASSREVAVFFENRALGMSMEYGLKQSLPPIKNLFVSLIDRFRIGQESAYLQIVLLDEKEDILVQATERGRAGMPVGEKKKYGSPTHPAGMVFAEGPNKSILIMTSYFLKGRYSGQIIAWINPNYVAEHIVKPRDHHPEWTLSLVTTSKTVYTHADRSSVSGFPGGLSDQPLRFEEKRPGEKARDMIGMASAVKDTPFLLVSRVLAQTVVGGLEPGRLLAGMGILAIVIIGGGLATVRVMTRTVLLQTRLDASLRHEQNVREKNIQLEKEIAERKQAEEALRNSEDRYRTLVETSPDVIFTLSLGDGIFRSINPVFEQITGWPRAEWIGKPFFEIIHPDYRAIALEKHREAINGAGVMRFDLRCLTRNGTYRITEVTTAPLLQNGVVSGRLGIARDITERTVLEEQLRQAVKMQAIGQLAGGIAHDFNNILSVIIGACDLVLLELRESNPARSKIQMVLASAERGAQLTRNLLTFSRKQVVRMQARNLNEIILSAEPLISRLIREDIRFSIDLVADKLLCMADSTQIEQALMNLAANARDAMAGGGKFTITSGRMIMDGQFRRERGFGREGEYAVLRVEDTGIGMDEKTRERIFEPFFTTKDVGKGTGLGLATVFGIVKQHNGYIETKSEVGRGTVFIIYLPLIAASADRAGAVASPEHRLRGSETVLVAEDEGAVRTIITQILAKSGYRVIEAHDGEDAEVKFHDHRDEIDLLIFDVIMPGKNGKQAYDSIKKIRPDLKCLFLSGYTADIISNSGISEKEGAFLQKPVPPHLLLTKVREILGASPIQ